MCKEYFIESLNKVGGPMWPFFSFREQKKNP